MTEVRQLASQHYRVDDIGAVQELYHSKGWTDGLPIVSPTEASVRACLEWAVMDPGQLIDIEPVRELPITAEKLAINEVLAGYRGYPFVVIDHPISSASKTVPLVRARATIEQLERLLLE